MRCTIILLLLAAAPALSQSVPNVKDSLLCPNSPDGRQPYRPATANTGNLQRIVINAPGAVCNDGTPAFMYVRPSKAGATEPDGSSASRWIIHFQGGSHCSTYEECSTRWCGIGQWEGTLMTTAFEGPTRNVEGLLGQNPLNRLGDRNVVLLKYCSSDNWQGRKSDVVLTGDDGSKSFSLHFRGATIVDSVLTLLEQGVPGMPRLTDASDVLVSGDSGGAKGARNHVDRISERLKRNNPNVRVRMQVEASFGPDLNGKQGFPAGDPRDPVYAARTADFNRVEVAQQNAQLDDSCLAAHPSAQYLCADDTYLEMNHITTPFFQIQDLQDGLLLNGLKEGGITSTPAVIGQTLYDQLAALENLRTTAVERAGIIATPGAVGRLCGFHVTFSSDDGFLGKKIRSSPNAQAYSYYELLWNWLTGGTPSTLLAPRPPSSPAVPTTDSICSARAPSSSSQAIATASNASYDFQGAVAPNSIVTSFGANLAASTQAATTTPWPTTLGGVQVLVTDSRETTRPAPLYYVSASQLVYLIPDGTAAGTAQITVGNQKSSVVVSNTAPGIYAANQTGKGVAAGTYVRITATGIRSEGPLADPNTLASTGIPAAANDQIYIVLYGTGLRGGAATATVGGLAVPVAGPFAHPVFPGLDQLNLGPMPARVGVGEREIIIRQGSDLANPVTVTFRAQ